MMNTEKIVTTLNDLIETCKDGEEGFTTCADRIDNTHLKTLFHSRAEACATAAAELQAMVIAYGGDPETASSLTSSLHRRWIDLKSMLTGHDDEAILNECERGEDVAVSSYRRALEKDLPVDVRLVVERQYQHVLQNHDEIKRLRDQARARS
jgi:uncharacterized protein (TIGR02284 family)